MRDLKYFKTKDFHGALRHFFKSLNIPVNYIAEEPARPRDILSKTYKEDKEPFQLMEDVYFLGMVDDAAFEGGPSLDYRKIESDYDGILIFGVTLHPRQNGLTPTRSQLAEITRAFNREFHYTPVVVVFRYGDSLAFANAERLQYKQEWREGEKAGKVSLLRDVDINAPHSGHLRILSELAISRSGKQAVNSFAALYSYWLTVFNVSLLNKKFYEELSNWYFWAIREVTFPGEPTIHTLFEGTGSNDANKLQEARHEHNAKNIIRLLTRFLFVWFIKEKKLIPPELFDLNYVKDELVEDLSPYHQEDGLFQSLNKKSHYYKAILQNLFFATLNQEMGKRDFRKDKQHMNVTNLLRYETCFKNPQTFIKLVETVVPFMNGGLFECLDKPHPTAKGPRGGDVIIYEDGFSDRDNNSLVVPDYLFFGLDEEVDLSQVIGIANKKTQQAAVKGLINIFESYKFTIAENTPIEEDIALDPELLGKVFENLLASYNPETKTTARKQTGSFYTPREIVNYMVDESLIAYLKSAVPDWGMEEEELDGKLHQLLSFDPGNPFTNNTALENTVIKALDNCAILDPACGSGAFPMGILQKMVHVLQKLDPDNSHWHELQMNKALKETESAFHLEDKEARKQKLDEINEAFDEQINDPDYARKLFLIENCIYGVDIQPIAAQISKLRFFISLVADQKVDKAKENFGIRPLPNLETKFVAANTLIGIEKPEKQYTLGNPEIKKFEEELKNVRHRIFSAKTPKTKRKLREEDQVLREKMGELLIADGWANKTARQLAAWDPYDQNMSSPFFDPEWMFGMKDGFDVVIGNPPYGFHHIHSRELKEYFRNHYDSAVASFENYFLFYEKSLKFLRTDGTHSFIVPVTWLTIPSAHSLRKFILSNFHVLNISWLNDVVFENAQVNNLVSFIKKSPTERDVTISRFSNASDLYSNVEVLNISQKKFIEDDYYMSIFEDNKDTQILKLLMDNSKPLGELCMPRSGYNPYEVGKGQAPGGGPHTKQTVKEKPYHSNIKKGGEWKPEVIGRNLSRYGVNVSGDRWIKYGPWLAAERDPKNFIGKRILVQEIVGGTERRIIAAYYDGELYHSRDVIPVLISSSSPHAYLLLAIINSTLITWYHHKRSPKAKKGLFPKVLVSDLKKIPITNNLSDVKSSLLSLVELIMYVNYSNNKLIFHLLDEIIDGLVFQLYFPDHMKEKQIDILQFVEKDLAEVMQGRNFEQLPDSDKETVINQLHARWTHPDSEVRNRIKLFAVRSPDILKPILESR